VPVEASGPVDAPDDTAPDDATTITRNVPRRGIALRWGGPLWTWPILGVALVAIAGELFGRTGALLVAGTGLACFALVGSELLFGDRVRLYASGVAFCAGAAIIVLALVQPAPATPASRPAPETARPVNKDLLARPTLDGIDLHGADLRGFNLRDTTLNGATLAGAKLDDARLDGASLRGADLRGADLRNTCLKEVDLRGALLAGAVATGADATGAHLTPGATTGAIAWPTTAPSPSPCG